MKKIALTTGKIFLLASVFIVFFITPTILLPVSEAVLSKIRPEEMQGFFPLLLLFALYVALTYFLLLRHRNQSGMVLMLPLLMAHFLMYPLMGLLETLFWGDAFKGVSVNEFLRVFLRFCLTFGAYTIFLVWISGRLKSHGKPADFDWHLLPVVPKILLIASLYFVLYNLFGYFIAWQFEAARVFYSGSAEDAGFVASMLKNISDPTFVVVHYFRGILFGVAAWLFHQMLGCSQRKKILILALLFGGFGFQIILPNPFFPATVRIAHFIETTSSMLLFGALSAMLLNSRKGFGLTALLSILILFASCRKQDDIRFGFDSEIAKNSRGLCLMHVGSDHSLVELSGWVALGEGAVVVELLDASGEVVFEKLVETPGTASIDQTFEAVSSNWKLGYRSLDGKGSLKLQLSRF